MPIYLPRYSPRQNPFGQLEDITPPGAEVLFRQAYPAAIPPVVPSNQIRLNLHGRYTMSYYWGTQETVPDTAFHFYMTEDQGNTWRHSATQFPKTPQEYHVPRLGLTNSRYEDSEIYLAMPVNKNINLNPTPAIATYKTSDKGENWNLAWDINLNQALGASGAQIENHSIFPTSNGIYQVLNASIYSSGGTWLSQLLLGFKNGQLVYSESMPFFGALKGVQVSSYNKKHEIGFFQYGITIQTGGDSIYRVDGNGIQKTGAIPLTPSQNRSFIDYMAYVPENDTLLMATFFAQGARIYRSFNQGATFQEYPGGWRINASDIINYHRRGIFENLSERDPVRNLGRTYRSHSLFDDVTDTIEYDSVINAIDGKDRTWTFGFPLRNTRRVARLALWERFTGV
jgi:hypothetical protein